MTDLTSLTLAEARDGLANKSFTSLELTDAHLEAIEAARALNAFVMETPDQARAMAREADAKIAKGEGGPLAGIPLAIKDCSRPRTCAPPRARKSSAISCRPTNSPSPRSSGGTARSCSASSTMTSSRWARRTRPRASARWSIRGGARRQHHAGAGRLVRRLGLGGRGAVCAWARPRPTPAVRSVSRRRSPAPSA